MHAMTFDEFKETLHSSTYDFGPFLVYVRGYSKLLMRHGERDACYFLTLYDQIHRYCENVGTADASMHDRIVRAILTFEP